MIWNIVGLLSFVTIVAVVVRFVRRNSDKDLDAIRKQASCHHPYSYMFLGKRLCAKCGKEMPRLMREFNG